MAESYGVEPIPADRRTVGWRDLFAINFTFYLSPLMYVFGALAVVAGGLPFWWAVGAMMTGQALAFALLVVVAQVGVDYGLPGQVALRATLGFWGARLLSSPYRVVAATYWFAAQALAGALGCQAIVEALTGDHVRLVPIALALAAVQAALAVLGFDVMRYVFRCVMPLGLALTGVLVGLFLASDAPRYSVSRVFDSPGREFTWVGFATFVTVMCGASLTYVTNIADVSRYTRTRRDMRIGLLASGLAGAFVPVWVGAYAAAATGQLNPFVAVVDLTGSTALLAVLLAALVVQTTAVNITNAYTAGLSLVNSIPRLGRLRATASGAAVAVALSAFPDFVDHAQRWVVHLGNVAAPLTGVVLADYLFVKRTRIEVPELFDPSGRYRYRDGLNVAAALAVAVGVGVYYAVPHTWVKVLWGIAAAGSAYLVLASPALFSADRGAVLDESLELPERARERAFGQS
jgi:nucleobase:cation symporter-1, NCS1 family